MRTLLATLVLLAFLTALVPAPVNAQTEPAPLAEDASGDVKGTPIGGPTQPVSGFEDVDLTALFLTETPDTFDLRVRLAHMDGQPGPDQPGVKTTFTFDGVDVQVSMYRSTDNAAWFGSLSTRNGETDSFHYVLDLAARYDVDAAEVWTSVPRDQVVGSSGRLPGHGDALSNVFTTTYASAGHSTNFNQPPLPKGYLLDIGDRLPDVDGLSLPVQFGGAAGSGGLSLTTKQPYRASNGAATTYVFDLEARNTGDADRVLTLEALGVPDGWNVTLPGTQVDLAHGATASFQVALATVFFHAHGSSRAFHLRLADANDDQAWATVELGIHYLAVPQPAGHHDTLWLHTHPWSETAAYVNPPLGGTTGIVTMNTLQEDRDDAGVPVVGYSSMGSNEGYGWAVCLDPGLAMGLDFDLSRTGQLDFPVATERPMMGAVLSGRLLRVAGGLSTESCYPSEYADLDVLELARVEATAPADIAPQGGHTFQATVTPLADADRVPYQDGAQLVLELWVGGDGVGVGGAGGLALQPGGSMTLPLQEYNDTVPVFQGAAEAGPGSVFSAPHEDAAKDAPGAPMALLVVGLAALVLVQRRAA